MRNRVNPYDERRKWREGLRRHTARLLHDATVGHSPQVAAALGVSPSRVKNQLTGEDCPNPLEILHLWLDSLEVSGADPAALDEIVRDLARRRHFGLVPEVDSEGEEGIRSATARAAREIGEALAAALSRATTPEEKAKEITDAMEALAALRSACTRPGARRLQPLKSA